MWKATGVSDSWIIMDNKRNTYNVMNNRLFADMSNAQSTTQSPLDFVSNGFKFRAAIGAASREYIYLAIAESPFQYSNAR